MGMGMQPLRIAVLLVVLTMAPAAAGRHATSGATHERAGCPHDRARADAAKAARIQPASGKGDRVADAPFYLARRSSALDL
jgi:hypothetical protein